MIENLLTPKHILEAISFPTPQVILPEMFPDFDSLLAARDDIRDLKVLPIKTNKMRELYKNADKNLLFENLKEEMNASFLFLKENEFPYFLPPDVKQEILWISSERLDDTEIMRYIDSLLNLYSLSSNSIIAFERPRNISEPMVKGTFPQMRHVHLWTRK